MSYTIQNLIGDSLSLYPGIVVWWPQFEKEEVLNLPTTTAEHKYEWNNGKLAFVADGCYYATPTTRRAITALDAAGFKHHSIYVPFSNGDYPKLHKERWDALLEMQKRISDEEFVNDCLNYSTAHGISALSEEVLAKCFEMPDSGVKVVHPYFEDVYYPIFCRKYFDCIHPSTMLGTYCTNNSRVVFLNRDGRTFVAKDYGIIHSLIASGYKKYSLFVPFSNGEKIVDPALRRRWEAIPSGR